MDKPTMTLISTLDEITKIQSERLTLLSQQIDIVRERLSNIEKRLNGKEAKG